jgi:hypothetical protein
LGQAYAKCGKPEEAESRFQSASTVSAPGQIRWAWLAAGKLPSFDEKRWNSRLEAALAEAESLGETSASASYWVYTSATLHSALGHQVDADATFRKVFLLPDRMLAYHLTRLALVSTPQ